MTFRLTIHGYLYTIWIFGGKVTKANARLGILGWTLPHLYIHAEENGWKLRRQKQHLKAVRKTKGLCVKCGKETVTQTLCLRHAVKMREAYERKGFQAPRDCASRRAEQLTIL